MRLIQKAGPSDAVSSTYVGADSIVINLKERWPASARFEPVTGDFVIELAEGGAVRLRVSHPIHVASMEIEKDQVVAAYRRAN